MSQNVCPNCGKEISESQFCLHCGMPLTEQAKKSPSQLSIKKGAREISNFWIFLMICLLFTPIGGIILFLFFLPSIVF